MNDIDKMPSKCQGCTYWEVCEYPYICDDIKPKQAENGNLNAEFAKNPQDRLTDELIRKQDALDAIHCNITVTGRQNAELVAAAIGVFADRIKALPPVYVPDTNVGDMISRQAAMERLMAQNVIMDGSEYHNGFNAGVNRAQEVIRNLSPVQPTQPNCEYCHTDRDGYVFPLEKNSHAFIDRDKIVLKANGWRGKAKIKYCPICGRRLTDG